MYRAMLSVVVLLVPTAYSQTQIDLRLQGRDVDFSGAAFTRPVQTGSALPSTCQVGALFFLTGGSGSNLYGCTSANQWSAQAGGSLSVSGAGSLVGSGTSLNFSGGFGELDAISESGTQFNIQQGVDTSVIPSKAATQSGAILLCQSAGGSSTSYTCAMSPTLTAYTPGMVLHWIPDVSGAGGATTLNVDTLGSVPVFESDGTTVPTTADILAGRLYPLWYDGASFRLMVPRTNVAAAGVQPPCTSALRGLIWQTLGASGVKDTVSVCAKDSSDVSAWRSLY